MPREQLYHILLWTGDGRNFFLEKRKDRERFLKLLRKARKSGDLRVYAYCLLKDRLQFLCSCPSGMIEKILASVEGVYRNYCQSKYRDKAPVWDHAVYECGWEGLVDLVRYVHRAPVRAEKSKGLTYRWSSHREYLAGGDQWVDYRTVLKIYGKNDNSALRRYKRFIHAPAADQPATSFYIIDEDPQETEYIPETITTEDSRSDIWEPHGSVEAAMAEASAEIAPPQGDKSAASGKDMEEWVSPDTVIAITAELMGVSPASMKEGGGVAQETAARRVALYVLKEDAHLTNAETGRVLGMAASTVSRWYNNTQWRDDLNSRIKRVKQRLHI